MREEESASGFGVEESLILPGGKLEVAVNVAALESQVQDLRFLIVGDRREHFRFDRQPGHRRSSSLILNRVHDSPIVDTTSIEMDLRVTQPPSPPEPSGTGSRAAVLRS